MTLTLKIANQPFCMTLHLIKMHDNTKFGNKMFGDLEDIIWTNMNILTLCYDRDPECSNLFFSQDTLAYNVKSSDQVWLPRNQQFRKYSRKSHIWIIPALAVTLTLKTVNQSFCRHSGLTIIHHSTKFGHKILGGLENVIRTNTDSRRRCKQLFLTHFKPKRQNLS